MRWNRLALPILAVASALPLSTARAEPPEAPKRKALTDKEKAEVLPLLRAYLEPDSELGFKYRMNLLLRLKALKEAGTEVLADVEGLRTLLYGSRPFHPAFEKKNLPKEAKGAEVVLDTASNVTSVVWDELRLSVALPARLHRRPRGEEAQRDRAVPHAREPARADRLPGREGKPSLSRAWRSSSVAGTDAVP